jgi:uncharacterized protein YkwD
MGTDDRRPGPARRAGIAMVAGALASAISCATLLPARRRAPLRIVAPDLSRPLEDSFRTGGVPSDRVSRVLFAQIIADREAAGVPPVLWDESAARLARGYAERQLAEGIWGHFLTDGDPPYARSSAAGLLGFGAENSSAALSIGGPISEDETSLALEAHRQMLEERPPNDGHRKTILDPTETHVGVGVAWNTSSFRLVEEFFTRRYEWLRVEKAGTGVALRISGKTRPPAKLEFVTVSRESLPAELSAEEAVSRRSYSYPMPEMGVVPEGSAYRVAGVNTIVGIEIRPRNVFTLQWGPSQPGLWTLIFHFRSPGDTHPVPGAALTLRVE